MTGDGEFLRFRLTVRLHEDDETTLPMVLRRLADRYEAGAPVMRALPVLDGNGNTIGTALLFPDEDPAA
jgi:hypothetical protein